MSDRDRTAARPIFEIVDELVENVSVGAFGPILKSVRFADVEDPDEETPNVLVIVATGEQAALLNEAYTDITSDAEWKRRELCG